MISVFLWMAAGAVAGGAAGCWVLLALADINPTVHPAAVDGLLRWLTLSYGVIGATAGALVGVALRMVESRGLAPLASRLGAGGLAVAGIVATVLAVSPLRALSSVEESAAAANVPAPLETDTRVLLLGLDGIDWRILDELTGRGELPTFASLIANGARAPLATFEPTWSPLIWNTIATGAAPETHGILDFGQLRLAGVQCGPQRLLKRPTLIPSGLGFGRLLALSTRFGVAREVPVSSCHRREHALWNQLDGAGLRVAVLNWFASYPAESVNGYVVSDNNPFRAAFLQMRHGALEDVDARITYPTSLLERLGEIDIPLPPEEPIESILEHRVFSEYSDDDRAAATSEEQRELLSVARLIIATDIFVAKSTAMLLREERPDFTATYLSGTDNISHRFGKTTGVALQYYRFLDTLLADIVDAAGPDTTIVVVSDHGWNYEGEQYGHFHAPDGIFLISGPGARAGTTLQEKPRMHDVAPTVLALFGIPPSDRFGGKAVRAAIAPERASHTDLASIDYGDYRPPSVDASQAEPSSLEAETMDKLRALGYVE